MSEQEEKVPESVSGVSAEKRYRMAWKSKETGYEGHGEWFDDFALVDYVVKEGNKNSRIDHWIESSPSPDLDHQPEKR